MPVPRRTLSLLLLGLAPVAAGCLHTQGATKPPPARPSEFAVLPPGTRIPTNTPRALPNPPAAEPPVATRSTSDAPPSPAPLQPTARVEPNPLPPLAAAPDPSRPPVPRPGIPTPPAADAGPATPPADPPLVAAMRAYAQNRPDDALRHLQSLDKASQDFALAVLPALARVSQVRLDSADPTELALLVEQVDAAVQRLEPRAALRVDRVAFCRRVEGFGRYEPRPTAEPYRPGTLAELYVEVRNLNSPGNGEGFVTALTSTLEVRDASQRLVEQADPANPHLRVPAARFERSDFSRTAPRDYFLVYRFAVPATPGVYTASVEIRDTTTGRAVKSKLAEFRVAGP